MNIFPTDRSAFASAMALDDKRVVRQASEAVIILSTAVHSICGVSPYKPHQPQHKLIRWMCAAPENLLWSYNYALGCNLEYTGRYKRECVSYPLLLTMAPAVQDFFEGAAMCTDQCAGFANCASNKALSLDFTGTADTIVAYRDYLRARWERDTRPPTWTGREAPTWR